MTPRNIRCMPLNDIFRDFEREGLSMSWVYGNIGRILLDAKISVYGEYVEIHEKVNIHHLKRALIGEDHFAVKQVASYLWSSLSENKIADASEICKFLRGECESYDNMDNFNVVYNFKELIADIQLPCLIPSTIASNIKYVEWKSCSLLREFAGSQASDFRRENQLHRLHDSTTLYVELTDLQFETCRQPELRARVTAKHNLEIQNQLVQHNAQLRTSSPEATEGSQGQVHKEILSEGLKHDWVGFLCYFYALDRNRLLLGDGKSHIKDPFLGGAQASIIRIMDEWFAESGSVPAKNQLQRYAKEILAAIKLNAVKSNKSK
jgi:hypothetical protein